MLGITYSVTIALIFMSDGLKGVKTVTFLFIWINLLTFLFLSVTSREYPNVKFTFILEEFDELEFVTLKVVEFDELEFVTLKFNGFREMDAFLCKSMEP